MSTFPESLKIWRKTRRCSQLDLALEANVSSRHISFLETGRARPSAEMILRLGEALSLPLTARNQMLTQAGFAARYPARKWDAADMAPIRAAMEHTLAGHAPYPAIALDRLWTVVRMNAPTRMLFAPLNVGEGDSMLDLVMSDALPPLVENWPEVAHHSAQRLRTESAAQGGVAALDRAANHLSRTPLPIGRYGPGRADNLCAWPDAHVDVHDDRAVRHARGPDAGRHEDRAVLSCG